MEYLGKCRSVEELKKEYRRLALRFHPDLGGDTKTMAIINSEYKIMMDILERYCNKKSTSNTAGTSTTQKKTRKRSYYTADAIKEFTDRYFSSGGNILRIDSETCLYYGEGLKTVIIKEVQHKTLGTVYTSRFYNKMPKKYADLLVKVS